MDYEKKYKQALDAFIKFRDAYKTTDHSVTYKEMKKLFANVEDSFPELKESEDEKIRKALISFLKSPFVNENITDEKVTPWITYLEKQGEQKSVDVRTTGYWHVEDVEKNSDWSEEDEQMLGKCIDAASGYYSPEDKQSMKDWLRNIKERYTWKPSEGQLECLGYAIEKAKKDWSPLINNRIYLTLKTLKEQLEKLREE